VCHQPLRARTLRVAKGTCRPQIGPDLLDAAERQSEIQRLPFHARRRPPERRGRSDQRGTRGSQLAQSGLVLVSPELVRIPRHCFLDFCSGTNADREQTFIGADGRDVSAECVGTRPGRAGFARYRGIERE